ncbi:glycoside hydrolase family 65 protein [Miltoncostaea marina]|uniref:glycoside hydrolase family 65 protein n=1 Tax=Miltoncostaea marina TaxID=2843215 RepID=UPI001C3E01D4|nr:glycosyl hydrolase family 65 protein [Miltoncostaea marina]
MRAATETGAGARPAAAGRPAPIWDADGPWIVREPALDPRRLGLAESVFALANGHLGLRGNLDEGEPRAIAGTYLNGFHETLPPARAAPDRRCREADQFIVNVTDGKLIRLLVEDEPLDVSSGRLERHERSLDMRTGQLTRELVWTTRTGRPVRVTTRRLVSLRMHSVAAISYEVEALGAPSRIALQSNLLANPLDEGGAGRGAAGPVLVPRLSALDDLRVVLAHTTARSGLSLAAGMDHVVESESAPLTRTTCEPDLGRVTLSAMLTPGRPLRLVKLLAYHWSADESVEWLRDQVDASLQNALAEGFDGLARMQADDLHAYWRRTRLDVDGDPELARALRFAQFQLVQAATGTDARAIAATGLTGPAHDGHVFWDTEAYVLPVLAYSQPHVARDALRWRHSTLGAARRRARRLGLSGAVFPWRTIDGAECSDYWPAATAALHLNADIARAVALYADVTLDEEFEREAGVELLVETARLWAGYGHHGEDGRFHIERVTGPDEYSALEDDNAYTNLMARDNMRFAADASERHPAIAAALGVDADEVAAWRRAAAAMALPYDARRGVHQQSAGSTDLERWDFARTAPDEYPLHAGRHSIELYRRQVVKQADLVMAVFTCPGAFGAEGARRAFEYYEELTVRDSPLSASMQAIVAAEVGHTELAYDYLREAALSDLEDLAGDIGAGLHMASLAGGLLAAIAGLAGLRRTPAGLAFRPRLPAALSRLAFPVVFRGRRLVVEVLPGEARYRLDPGDGPMDIEHWGEPVRLERAAVRPIPPAPPLPEPRQPAGRAPRRRVVR